MNFRLSHFSIAASIICGILIIVFFKSFAPEETNKTKIGESWAVLVLDEAQEDLRIRESLAGAGDFISESSQEVFIDDFGEIRKIPLVSFYDEIEEFDPRNDGYAAKLHSFFVRDGKRLFFLPLEKALTNRSWALKKQLSSLLPDTLFSLVVLGRTRSVFMDLALLAAACGVSLCFSKSRRLFIPVLPVLISLAWGGAPAVVLAAVLAAIWELLREPLGELFAARSYHRREFDYAGAGIKGFLERLIPFRANLLLAAVFFLCFLAVSAAGVRSPIPFAFSFVFFFFLYFLSCESETRQARENRHTRFRPVPLFPLKVKSYSLFPFLLPFMAAACLALVLPLALPGFSSYHERPSFINPEYFVSSDDFSDHLAFQRSFSYRSMNHHDSLNHDDSDEYLRYDLGADGLIAENTGFSAMAGDRWNHSNQSEKREEEVPRFPLEKLMDFLIQYY